MEIILHIAKHQDWKSDFLSGYYKPASLTSDGFIHCSTITQTAYTANQFFQNQNGLILLCIDTHQIESELEYESPACEGDQRIDLLFPHIYGPLNISAVVRIFDFSPDKDGIFKLPDEINAFKSQTAQ